MQTYRMKHVDAFTREPWRGNPAGVVLDARGLSDQRMQDIAREMNLSETAFVLPPSQQGADLRVRWFTPTHEVDLCGHATIASFHALSEEGKYGMEREGKYRFTVETRSGLLGIVVDKTSAGDSVQFELPIPSFEELKEVPLSLLASLGLDASDLMSTIPIVSDVYAYVPVVSREKLFSLRPAYRELANACRSLSVGGVCVFTLDTIDKGSAVHSRFFAPALGVDEDPVTGSANGPLGVYLSTYLKRSGTSVAKEELSDGRIEYIGEQGDVFSRPGRVAIRVALEGEEVRRVWIAGHAVTVMDATLRSIEKD